MHMNMVSCRYGGCCRTNDFTILQDFFIQCDVSQGNLVSRRDEFLYQDIVLVADTAYFYDFIRRELGNRGSDMIDVSDLDGGFFSQNGLLATNASMRAAMSIVRESTQPIPG